MRPLIIEVRSVQYLAEYLEELLHYLSFDHPFPFLKL